MDARCGDNTKSTELKNIEKLQEKAIGIIKFLPYNNPVLKKCIN